MKEGSRSVRVIGRGCVLIEVGKIAIWEVALTISRVYVAFHEDRASCQTVPIVVKVDTINSQCGVSSTTTNDIIVKKSISACSKTTCRR